VRRNLVIGAAVVGAVVLVLVFRPAATTPAPPATSPKPATITAAAVGPAARPKLLDLGASSCIPCKAMVPVLDGLRSDYAGKLDVEFIDIWKNREAGEAWHVEIMPTQVFIAADGRELARHQGFISREGILAQWQKLGVALD
jgi:thioredoxin 1